MYSPMKVAVLCVARADGVNVIKGEKSEDENTMRTV